MHTPSIGARAIAIFSGTALAIAAATAFSAGGLIILLGGDLLRPAHWTSYHVLTMLAVGGTVAAGHLAGLAARARAYLPALGFVVLFALGTGLVVSQSVGRQAEATGERASQIEGNNGLIADRRRALDQVRADIHELSWLIKYEMAGRPKMRGRPDLNGTPTTTPGCGTMCKGYDARRQEAEDKAAGIEREIAKLGTPREAEPKAARLGEIAALAGFDAGAVAGIVRLIEPLMWTLFFEIGSIISLGFAASGAARSNRSTARETAQSSLAADDAARLAAFLCPPDNPEPTPPRGPRKRRTDGRTESATLIAFPVTPHRTDGRRDQVLAELKADIEAGRTVTQGDLLERSGVPRSTLSDWLAEWERDGLIPARRTVGRRKEIAR